MLDVMPDEVAMAIVALEGSISQGRRSRAGGSLMEQLEFVLNLHNFVIDTHFVLHLPDMFVLFVGLI